MREQPDPALASEFESLINAGEDNENEVQAFIERHTAFLPTPGLLNHQLHMDSLISKFPVGDRKTDFAYLTKSSDRWKLVLVELESPAKKLFTRGPHVATSAAFNAAIAQITTWKEHWTDLRSDVERRLRPLLVPPGMARNAISVEFVLVIGRAADKVHDDARRRRLASYYDDSRIHVMTYDTLLNSYLAGRGEPKALLTVRAEGYKLQRVEQLPEMMFAYMEPQHLTLSAKAEAALRADGYAIDAWKQGQLLAVNGKWPLTRSDIREMREAGISRVMESIRRRASPDSRV